MTPWSQESYIKALLFAANAHNSQKIPGAVNGEFACLMQS